MYLPFVHDPDLVGREDRLIRGALSLSLLLLGGFSLITFSGLPIIPALFLLGATYFAVTAVTGRDPIYTHTDIDTRSDSELGIAGATTSLHDLTGHSEQPETSLLNR